jgi:prepilin peptidase CpaA
MALILHHLALGGFALLMAAAAFEDFRRYIIPNALPIGLCLLWPLNLASAADPIVLALGSLGCASVVFIVGALLFARGYIGGGDVKLLSAATLWAGPTGTPALLIGTGIFGGMLALMLLAPFGNYAITAGRALLERRLRSGAAFACGEATVMQVPYGVAIAAAAVTVMILLPHFN